MSIVSKIPMPSTGDVLGRYTLGTKGILHSKKDGTQVYEGYIGGYDDLYDFNPDPSRSYTGELYTRIGALGGELYGRHADYPIQIQGRIPVRKVLTND